MIKLFESFQSDDEIKNLCKQYNIFNYTINDDKSISVHITPRDDIDREVRLANNREDLMDVFSRSNGIVDFYKKKLKTLPLRFRKVDGLFNCMYNELESLDGCPDFVGSNFNINYNELESLVGGPKRVDGVYYCINNNIMTFDGFPEHVGDEFICHGNQIYEIWSLFEDVSKVELLNEMNPLRVINGKPHVILDIMNDFLSTIGKNEVGSIYGYRSI